MANQPTTFVRVRFFNDTSTTDVTGFTFTPKRGATTGAPTPHTTPVPPTEEVRVAPVGAGTLEDDHPDTVDFQVTTSGGSLPLFSVSVPVWPGPLGSLPPGRCRRRLHGSTPCAAPIRR